MGRKQGLLNQNAFDPASFSFPGTTKQTKANTFAISETLYQAFFQQHRPGWLTDIMQNHTAAPFEAVVKAEMSHAHYSNRDPQQADPNRFSRLFSWLVGHLPFPLHLWGTQAGHNGARRGRTGAALGLGGSYC